MITALVYAAFGMNNGGFSGFALPLLSTAGYVLAVAFPVLQLALGLVARASDQSGA